MAVDRLPGAAASLVAKWASLGLTIRPGCTPAQLEEFQVRTGFVLPADLREFLELANGIESDDQGFSFWPLEAYETFLQVHGEHAIDCPRVADSDRYYVFCDYLHWSWGYAIRLARGDDREVINCVVPVGMNQIFTVATSFSDFVDHYLSDSASLYPPE